MITLIKERNQNFKFMTQGKIRFKKHRADYQDDHIIHLQMDIPESESNNYKDNTY